MKKPRDFRALIFYVIAVVMLWQFGTAVGNICTDTFSKISTRNNPVLSFVYAQNTGGAFSLFQNYTFLLALLGVFALIGVFVYVWIRIKFEDKFKILACVLFSAGILGNLYERLTLGYVVDYIKLNFVNFAIFNAYDVMISVSVAMFAVVIIVEELLKNGKNKV